MKKNWRFIMLILIGQLFFVSCGTGQIGQAGGVSTGALRTVQNVLNSGILEAFGIMGNKNSYLSNTLIEAALPKELKDLNEKLEKIGLNSVVQKEKDYIAQIAASSVETAKPILQKAINEMTMTDAVTILAGGKDAGTQYLKNKTAPALTAALSPKIENQLQSLGVTSLLDNALGGKNSSLGTIVGAVMGTGNTGGSMSNQMTSWVTSLMVNGIFNVVADKEVKSRSNLLQGVNSILGTGQ